MDSGKSIIELAIAAQLIDHRDTEESLPPDFVASLKEFATLVRAQALEEAAGVCDREAKRAYQNDGLDDGYESGKSVAAKNCADAIRQLKETK